MKVCIVGAGAVGGFIGARLAAAGDAEVCALARGASLRALQEHGWRLTMNGALLQTPARADHDAVALGVQDLVLVAVKAQSLAGAAKSLAPLIGPHTVVLPAMNGVPWWFCETWSLDSVDPGGVIAAHLPHRAVVGCVVHASVATSEPGWVAHHKGNGLIVGEPAGGKSQRVQDVADLLQRAGFNTSHSADIRYDIWYKLWGNLTMNPVSAMTGATSDRVLADPLVRDFCSAVMLEAAQIGRRIGCVIEQTPEQRHAMAAELGAFKSSMLQDVQAGRSIELDAIVAAVQEIGQRLQLPTPHINALLGLTRLFGRTHGLYPEAVG
ncbi:MAG: 2-dehydropantoate 2-reductase [Pseudorhodobacter sp.]|nr:2-dehydropantoate 2-reductase [Rhizobacter sp.]